MENRIVWEEFNCEANDGKSLFQHGDGRGGGDHDWPGSELDRPRIVRLEDRSVGVESTRKTSQSVSDSKSRTKLAVALAIGVVELSCRVIEGYFNCVMGMMGMFKWLRKDIVPRSRNGWSHSPKQFGLNNESYRNALQAFINRRRFSDDVSTASLDKSVDIFQKNNSRKNDNETRAKSIVPGVPHIDASEIFEICWVAGTEDRYIELMFSEWQNTRVSLKRYTHPDCREAIKADLEVLTEIRHPNVILLMATTQTEDHDLISVLETVDCTLYNYIHEQGERMSVQEIAYCGVKLADALRHSQLRGFVHGAVNPHCVYFAAGGVVKLGGWELATRQKNPNPDREYEELLRSEIFRWQAPEIFYGCIPCLETDVYGLSLLLWEMCTMQVPWNGYTKSEVEQQYLTKKQSITMDSYNIPPLLYNLLGVGLQLDVAKRTLDMNRMLKFLLRLEMQYENEGPIYINESENKIKERSNTFVIPSVTTPVKLFKAKKSWPKQFFCKKSLRSSSLQKVDKISSAQVNLFDNNQEEKSVTNEIEKNSNLLFDIKSLNLENTQENVHPWQNTYKKVKPTRDIGETENQIVSVEDESEKDPRDTIKKVKEAIANDRRKFFYGVEASEVRNITRDTKSNILMQTKSKDYEPHKPASHKTSLEPKCNKSPGEYDPKYAKRSHDSQKYAYLKNPTSIQHAVLQPEILNQDPQSFFESSLWRKEKLICISKMSKFNDDDRAILLSQRSTNMDSNLKGEYQTDTLKTNATYTINNKSPGYDNKSVSSQNTYRIRNESYQSENTYNLNNNSCESGSMDNSKTDLCHSELENLKKALDRATNIVCSVSPTNYSPPFKSYENFNDTVSDDEACKIFEDIYDLRNRDNEEIRSIEKSESSNTTFLLEEPSFVLSKKTDEMEEYESVEKNDEKKNISNQEMKDKDETITERNNNEYYNSKQSENICKRTFFCESIPELCNESTASNSDSKSDISENNLNCQTKKMNSSDNKVKAEIKNRTCEVNSVSQDATHFQKREEEGKSNRMLTEGIRDKSCNSCHQKDLLPRRRSLPATLGQLRGLNNSALGKLPIRKGDLPDNTVEDLYIDDEFGDSLNVNMVLLYEDLDDTLDDDLFPEISEL